MFRLPADVKERVPVKQRRKGHMIRVSMLDIDFWAGHDAFVDICERYLHTPYRNEYVYVFFYKI